MQQRRLGTQGLTVSALEVRLSADDLAAIERVAPVGVAAGGRYAPAGMKTLNH